MAAKKKARMFPEGYNPHMPIHVGEFSVQLGHFHYNAWLVAMGVKEGELTPDQLRFWIYLNGSSPKKAYTGKIKYLAANRLAPVPLPEIVLG